MAKIHIQPGQKLFFTSDTHYNHKNICSATTEWDRSRPGTGTIREFKSLNDMNRTIVDNINKVVGKNDILIHLGDWSFGGFDSIGQLRNQIVCETIWLILGNHDHHIKRNRNDVKKLFAYVDKLAELTVYVQRSGKHDKHRFFLSHYPIASWPDLKEGVIHLHGHVHLPHHRRMGIGKMMDVGVDGNNLSPIELNDVLRLMETRPIDSMVTKDHHLQTN